VALKHSHLAITLRFSSFSAQNIERSRTIFQSSRTHPLPVCSLYRFTVFKTNCIWPQWYTENLQSKYPEVWTIFTFCLLFI